MASLDFRGKTVLVVGLGRSGVAALRRAAQLGASVLGVDDKSPAELPPVLADYPLHTGLRSAPYGRADLVVVSPGVPSFPELESAARSGVEVIGELEFAVRQVAAPVVAIGGTNGKSTTTMLAGAMALAAGRHTFVGGNLGVPLSEVLEQPFELVVLETSSFQLERVRDFHPHSCALLNITEDHLDRYASFQDYADAKGNAFLRQTGLDRAVIPAGDEPCLRQARRGQGQLVSFGVGVGDYRVEGQAVQSPLGRLELAGSKLHGAHNFANAAAAFALMSHVGVSLAAAQEAITCFEPLGHRMALAAVVNGIPCYDDSKGTNVGAAVTALRGLLEPRAVLIAGGRDKHGDYAPLVDALVERGRAAVLIGEAAPRIAVALGAKVPWEHAATLAEAVERALALAEPGDAVLLSPACSSFDMFQSYSDRGRQFSELVRARAAGGAA